jgi:hypothetical protein
MDQIHTDRITNEKIFRRKPGEEVQETFHTSIKDTKEKNTDRSEVKAFMRSYYKCLQKNDRERLSRMTEDQQELKKQQKALKKYIENYQNLFYDVYPGADENSYIVYVTYEMKIRGIKTAAPGMTPYYVTKKDDSYLIWNNAGHDTKEMQNAKKKSLGNARVKKLIRQVNEKYEAAVGRDQDLRKFFKESR